MKGIILNYRTIKQIIEYSPEKLNLDEIGKLSTIDGKKVWIKKEEFVQIMNALNQLIKNDAFENIGDSQLFFINLSNSIAEFDILTILSYGKENIILNIEVKNENKKNSAVNVAGNLDSQLTKRINDHLQQMFIDENYLTIGYLNGSFYKSKYKKKNEDEKYISEENVYNFLKECRQNNQAHSMIQVSDNLSNIQNIYNKLRNGTFKMYQKNINKLNEIVEQIDNGKKVILCLAKPGYGKTVLALSLFFKYVDSKLLILNQKFYFTFYMNEYYNENRAFFGSDAYINQIGSNTISIIDEAQRLSKEDLYKIIDASKCTIIFGDGGQAFTVNDEFITNEMYIEAVKEKVGDNFHNVTLKEPIRYSHEVDLALKYIYDNNVRKEHLKKVQNFDMKLFNIKEDFFREYNSITESKKIFKMYNSDSLSEKISVKIDGNQYNYTCADRNYWNFSISGNVPLFGHTLHAISFDIENNFIFLDNLVYSEQRKMPIPRNIDPSNEIAFKKYINELDILLTRSKKALYVYVEDLRSFLWFNQKFNDIKNATQILD